MLQFEAFRENVTPFDHRGSYVAHWAGTNARLCQALERVNEDLGRDYLQFGYPWLTPVLGNGCLETRDLAEIAAVNSLPAHVVAALAARPRLTQESEPWAIAAQFTVGLISDRLGIAAPVPEAAPDAGLDTSVEMQIAALAVLAAALLTLLYHTAGAIEARPMNRAGKDRAVLARSKRAEQVEVDLIEPLGVVLDELKLAASRMGDDYRMLEIGVGRILDGLQANHRQLVEVDQAQIGLLTELAWFYLTKTTSVYPGWSDLLHELAMVELVNQDEHSAEIGRSRPSYNDITHAERAVRRRYTEVTKRSWNRRHDGSTASGADPGRQRFYDTFAQLVRSQAAARNRVVEIKKRPPVASLFVTTFDLEVEMALWAASEQPFVVAMPVNMVKREEGQAATCWLGVVIDPEHQNSVDTQLGNLRRPPAQNWFLISAEPYYGSSPRGNMPVVVRLNGGPLFTLPSTVTEDGVWSNLTREMHRLLFHADPPAPYTNAARQPVELVHGVLLDEYSAMQQTAADFVNMSPTLDSRDRIKFGLPDGIAGGASSYFQRFWMLMGVQLGDAPVRSRFAYQMVVPNVVADRPPALPFPKRSGLVVNRRIDSAAPDLLYWYGYDVVTAKCEDFVDDLADYVRHLGTPGGRFSTSGCVFDE